jgi:hypothetical protein
MQEIFFLSKIWAEKCDSNLSKKSLSNDFEITCWRSSQARIWNLKRPLARTPGEGSGGGGRRRTACRQVESVRRRAGSLIRCGWMEGASAPDREWTRPVIHEVGAVVASERDQSACLSQPVSQPEPEEKRVERAPCCRWCCCCWCRGPGPPPPACPCCCSPRRPRPTTAPLASSTKSGWVSPGQGPTEAPRSPTLAAAAQLPRRFRCVFLVLARLLKITRPARSGRRLGRPLPFRSRITITQSTLHAFAAWFSRLNPFTCW